MHSSAELTAADAADMNYVEFIALLRETNRCPGGKHSIRKILQDTFVGPHSRVLEIGSNTGFTSLEIARVVGANVVGIDPEPLAVEYSRELLAKDVPAVQENCTFMVGSAYEIPFADDSFDLVICGGATSFMDDKQRAVSEYYRVLKPWAFLSVTNLCYLNEPPQHIVKATSDVIGVTLRDWGPKEYLDIFKNDNKLELYSHESVYLGSQPEQKITEYIEYFMKKPHLTQYSDEVRCVIKARWEHTISTFNKNHAYLGFIRTILRKSHFPEEPELFTPQASETGVCDDS